MFQEELNYFIQNQAALVEKYNGRILLLQGEQVVGNYATVMEAYLEGNKRFTPGTFMIQPCKPGQDAYTVTISSLGKR